MNTFNEYATLPFFFLKRTAFCALVTFSFSASLFAFAAPAMAQNNIEPAQFCDRASDTAQTIECLNKELQHNQSHLNILFTEIQSQAIATQITSMNAIQSNWLAYRDAECAYEESWGSGEALARVYELSCLSDLTEKRIERLKLGRSLEENQTLPTFTPFERWQNVLMHDESNIFWNFAKTVLLDTNCDGIDDQITQGLSNTPEHNAITSVIGITHSQKTGRPALYTVALADHKENQEAQKCNGDLIFSNIETLTQPATEEEEEEPSAVQNESSEANDTTSEPLTPVSTTGACKFKIEFSNNSCLPLVIEWDTSVTTYNVVDTSESVTEN